MAEINADPDRLRQFAKTLASTSQQFEQLARQLQRSLDATNWKDSERQKFDQDFKQALRSISQFSERLKSDYVPKLQKKADALDRFRS